MTLNSPWQIPQVGELHLYPSWVFYKHDIPQVSNVLTGGGLPVFYWQLGKPGDRAAGRSCWLIERMGIAVPETGRTLTWSSVQGLLGLEKICAGMMSSPTAPSPLRVFISYSHRDEDLLNELKLHLALLKRQGKISTWDDRAVEAGTEWDAEIKHQLETAPVILLLVSANFIASDYCYDLEMQRAIQRHDAGNARVIPIILRPCDWQESPFSKLAILPTDAKPITTWNNQDEAFLNVVQGIRRAIDSLQATAATAAKIQPAATPPSSPLPSLPLSTYNPQTFTGRDEAIAHLTETLHSGCRLLVIHGMTGIGKTALAESLAARTHNRTPLPSPSPLPYVQVVLDRGISSSDFTRGAIAILHVMGDDTAQQLSDDQILPYLLKVLTERPCWLQLDSLEFLLRQDENGDYHFADRTWTDFFCQFLAHAGAQPNVPTIVLTSQALPVDLVEGCDRLSNLWHEYPLRGLEESHWLDLFCNYGVKTQNSTEKGYLCQIARYFDGHPLILKMIAGDIGKPVFGGSVSKYWQNYYSQQTRPKLHQSQEQRARNWINQTLQALPPLALQMLQRCSVFRRPVPESFYLQMPDDTSPVTLTPHTPHPAPPIATLTSLKSLYLVEEKDIQNGEILLQLHNLIRDAAYTQLKADHPTWSAAERKAADLWLTVYQPAPDAENLETVRGYLEAFDHYCEAEDWEKASEIYTRQIEQTQQALHWQLLIWSSYKELIRISDKLVDKISSTTKRICLNQLGNTYGYLGENQKAIEFYEKALKFTREIGDRTGEGRALGNLGLAYDSLGNYERAIDFHQQSLAIAREIGDRQGEGAALVNIGATQLKLEQYPDSLTNNQTALEIFQEIGDRANEAEALKNLAELHQQLGEGAVALEYCQQALALATELGIPLQKECEELIETLIGKDEG